MKEIKQIDRGITRRKPKTDLNKIKEAYSWYPKNPVIRRPPREDLEYNCLIYGPGTHQYPKHFIQSPEWSSQYMRIHKPQPFLGRRWKPWNYEFPGAQYWPHGTLENFWEEERLMKEVNMSKQLSLLQGEDGQPPGPPLQILETQAPPQRNSQWEGYVPLDDGRKKDDNRPHPSIVIPKTTDSSGFRLQDIQNHRGTPGYEEYFDQDSKYNSHPPDDVKLSNPSQVYNPPRQYANSCRKIPLVADAPMDRRMRFDRPYENFVNAMWIGSKYASSPGQA